MADLTVVILTYNEEKNIADCINSIRKLANRIVVIDSESTDKTIQIAEDSGAEVIVHPWEGFAKQFNWALDNCNINTEWVFRLDADERITKELCEEIVSVLNNENSDEYMAFALHWRMYFMGKELKHGGAGKNYVVRLFRLGKARVEDKEMDESLIVDGKCGKLKNPFIHFDYKSLDVWLNKHIWYSNLELSMYFGVQTRDSLSTPQNKRRGFYYKLPLFVRAKFYYWYRYYFQLGFLDGKEGKIFCFLQAYWFRFLVDAKIYEKKVKHK